MKVVPASQCGGAPPAAGLSCPSAPSILPRDSRPPFDLNERNAGDSPTARENRARAKTRSDRSQADEKRKSCGCSPSAGCFRLIPTITFRLHAFPATNFEPASLPKPRQERETLAALLPLLPLPPAGPALISGGPRRGSSWGRVRAALPGHHEPRCLHAWAPAQPPARPRGRPNK